jgi:hypothetical protein
MATLPDIRKRHMGMMLKTLDTLGHVLKNTTQGQATTLRDGPEGWTILEVVCHLRDFDGFFRHRAEMMLNQDTPDLPAYDHEALAIERAYNEQDLAYVYDELVTSRRATFRFFRKLSDADWQRGGNHPERESFSMTDAVMQVGLHDIDHLEQITRILEQEVPGSGSLPSEKI